MKTVLIGSVSSSEEMLRAMIDVGFPVSYIFSLGEEYSANVSGYRPFHQLAAKNNIPFKTFRRINDKENVEIIQALEPDYIFVIGLSQLVKEELTSCAKKGVIGFHPTPLPKMRGRAANVWQMLLGIHETKCSLFMIDQGIDSGDVLGQEEYTIEDSDYAADVERKICEAIGRLARRILPQISAGTIKPWKQDESQATYLLKRTPEDGQIDWKDSIDDIHKLIRAVSKPFPGAFSYYDKDNKFIFWRAEKLENNKYIGIPGQIAEITDEYIDVVCKDGLLRITEFENINNAKLIVGHKFYSYV